MAAAPDLLQEALSTALADARSTVRKGWSDGWVVPPRLKVSDWAQKNRKLPQEGSARPGDWDNAVNPLLVEPMDALGDDDPCTYVTIKKSTQSGGTEVGLNWIGWTIDHSPTSMMVVMDVLDNAKLFSEQRLDPMIEESPALEGKVRPSRERDSGNKKLLKKFIGGILKIAGALSPKSLRSMPVQRLILDEKDEYEDDIDNQGSPADLAERRTSTYTFRRKILNISSPKIKGASNIDKDYEASDQRQYFVACPHCDYSQTLKADQLRDDAVYICEGNGCEILESCKPELLRSVELGGKARWVAKHPERSHHHKGFAWNSLYTPLGLGDSWSDIVRMRGEAKNDTVKRKKYVNTVLGESFEDENTKIEAKDLSSRAGDWKMREVPKGCLVITGSVDVQANRFACKAIGWGRNKNGLRCWILDYVELPGSPLVEEDWKVVDDWRARLFRNSAGVDLQLRLCAVDSGNWTQQVYDYCRNRQHQGVFAVKGHRWGGKPIIGKPTLQDVNIRGRVIKQGVQLWNVGTDTAKNTIMGWILDDSKMLIGEEPSPEKLRVNTPSDLPSEVYDMLSAEVFDPELKRWVKIKGRRNEALDDFVYNLAAAYHPKLRLHTYREGDWAKLEQALEPEGDLFASAGTKSAVEPAKKIVPRGTENQGGFGSEDWHNRSFK